MSGRRSSSPKDITKNSNDVPPPSKPSVNNKKRTRKRLNDKVDVPDESKISKRKKISTRSMKVLSTSFDH